MKTAIVRMQIVTILEVPIPQPEHCTEFGSTDAKEIAWGMSKTEVVSRGTVVDSSVGDEVEVWRWEEEQKTTGGLCAAFLAEVGRVYGKDIAAESRCSYSKGWFLVKIAQRFPDKSVGIIGEARSYRKKEIEHWLTLFAARPTRKPLEAV